MNVEIEVVHLLEDASQNFLQIESAPITIYICTPVLPDCS